MAEPNDDNTNGVRPSGLKRKSPDHSEGSIPSSPAKHIVPEDHAYTSTELEAPSTSVAFPTNEAYDQSPSKVEDRSSVCRESKITKESQQNFQDSSSMTKPSSRDLDMTETNKQSNITSNGTHSPVSDQNVQEAHQENVQGSLTFVESSSNQQNDIQMSNEVRTAINEEAQTDELNDSINDLVSIAAVFGDENDGDRWNVPMLQPEIVLERVNLDMENDDRDQGNAIQGTPNDEVEETMDQEMGESGEPLSENSSGDHAREDEFWSAVDLILNESNDSSLDSNDDMFLDAQDFESVQPLPAALFRRIPLMTFQSKQIVEQLNERVESIRTPVSSESGIDFLENSETEIIQAIVDQLVEISSQPEREIIAVEQDQNKTVVPSSLANNADAATNLQTLGDYVVKEISIEASCSNLTGQTKQEMCPTKSENIASLANSNGSIEIPTDAPPHDIANSKPGSSTLISQKNCGKSTEETNSNSTNLIGQKKNKDIEEEETLQCRICYSKYEDGELLCILPCLHRFHRSCARPWFKVNSICPFCRTNITNLLL